MTGVTLHSHVRYEESLGHLTRGCISKILQQASGQQEFLKIQAVQKKTKGPQRKPSVCGSQTIKVHKVSVYLNV